MKDRTPPTVKARDLSGVELVVNSAAEEEAVKNGSAEVTVVLSAEGPIYTVAAPKKEK